MATDTPPPDWELAHRTLVRLAAERAAHEHALGKALLHAQRTDAWRALGFATFTEYVERTVGFRPRQTEERLRLARALENLPGLTIALAEGRLPYSAVRELSRVVVPETENEWLAASGNRTVGEIERMVSGRTVGDRPGDPHREEARQHTIVLHVSAETYAAYREAQAKLRRDADSRLSDEESLLLMARTVLGGPRDAGRSSYQVRVARCDACEQTNFEARGKAVAVDRAAAETARCDAQVVEASGKATQDIPPATRRLVVRRDRGTCAVPGCRNAQFVDVHHIRPRVEGGDHDPSNLIVLCAAHHGAVHRGAVRVDGRAPDRLVFRHADGSLYGTATAATGRTIVDRVEAMLIRMGYSAREAHERVQEVRTRVGADSRSGLERVLKEVLQPAA